MIDRINTYEEVRPENIDRLRRFARKTGLETPDIGLRVARFKSLTPGKFLDNLSVVNGLVQVLETNDFQRWAGKVASVVVGPRSFNKDIFKPPALIPPDNADARLIQKFLDIQKQLKPTQGSLDRASVQLYFAIEGAHIFPDGNGRTGRVEYSLLRNGALPEADALILNREASRTEGLCYEVNVRAVSDLLKAEGLPEDRIFDTDFRAANNPWEAESIEYGTSQHLNYLGLYRLLKADNPSIADNPPGYLVVSEQPQAIQDAFPQAYSKARDDWYDKFVEIPGQNIDYCIQYLDPKPVAIAA
ncbi:MAG: Fic family protein [Candidatus Saccharibacteria bacterium]|nr:Fic family protein [Candidatus Saccharibacteria bacterium]